MTSPDLERTNTHSKIGSVQNVLKLPKFVKPKQIEKKKIYYSDTYIYLDPNEFNIVWHNVLLFIFLHGFYFRALYGILTLDPDFFKCVPISK